MTSQLVLLLGLAVLAASLHACRSTGSGPETPAPGAARPSRPARAADARSLPGIDSLDLVVALAGAADAVTRDDPEEALRLLSGPDDLEQHNVAMFLRGVAHLRLGSLAEARRDLQRAVELQADDTASLTVLARVCYELDDAPAAIDALEQVVRLDPDDAQSRASLGLLHSEAGRLSRAFTELMAAVELDPTCFDGHRGLGLLFASIGQLDQAEHAYRMAAELDGDSVGVMVGLGHVLREQGRAEEALPWYRRACEARPGDPDHLANLAAALHDAGRPAEARRLFERTLAAVPEGDGRAVGLHLALGRVLEGLGDFDGAAAEYETTVLLDPSAGLAHEALGLLDFDAGRAGAARDHLEAALDLSGLSPDAVVALGLLYDDLGEGEDVRRCLELLRAAGEDVPEVAYRIAQLRVRAREPSVHDPGAGAASLRRLVAGELSGHAPAWQLLAEALALQGLLRDAVDAMDRALASSLPGEPAAAAWRRQREAWNDALGRR